MSELKICVILICSHAHTYPTFNQEVVESHKCNSITVFFMGVCVCVKPLPRLCIDRCNDREYVSFWQTLLFCITYKININPLQRTTRRRWRSERVSNLCPNYLLEISKLACGIRPSASLKQTNVHLDLVRILKVSFLFVDRMNRE